MARFRTKPVVIEAFQWDGSREVFNTICAAFGDAFEWIDAGEVGLTLIWGPRGEYARHSRVSVGDWIIQSVTGEVYPCTPDVFAETYEAVEAEDTGAAGPWTPFWWESNACWGPVESLTDWRAMVETYAETRGLSAAAAAKQMLDVGAVATWTHPNTALEAGALVSIGLRREHVGGTPFREWAKSHGMDLDLADDGEPRGAS